MKAENSLQQKKLTRGIIMNTVQKSNFISNIQNDDGLTLAGCIKERLTELVELLGSGAVCHESLVREINYLLKEYEMIVESAETFKSLNTRYDNW